MLLFVFCDSGYLLIFRIQTQTVGALNTSSILFFRIFLRDLLILLMAQTAK